ncbi:sensor histidine kinase [Umezawaea beigongshangensis]|uniref:sensor histidine kinase n=1 Tax=Umezawaea beigongshangensis TaxID=2780383 RepID=UPI0018F144ED|nr:nitrate- and nitrite sensing domain-containing protein [Umezawaea beigongshangensis]
MAFSRHATSGSGASNRTSTGRARFVWSSVSDWRNWRLPVKLAAVLAVPVLVAVVAGALQIRSYVESANSYAGTQQLVLLRETVAPLVTDLQEERTVAARRVDGRGPDASEYRSFIRQTDGTVSEVRSIRQATRGLGDISSSRYLDVDEQLGGLPALRDQIARGETDVATGVTAYSTLVDALQDFDQALVSQIGTPELSGTANALHQADAAREQIARQEALILSGIARGRLLGAELRALEESDIRLQDELRDFQAIATPEQRTRWERGVTGVQVAARQSLVGFALTPGSEDTALPMGAEEWLTMSNATDRLVESVRVQFADELSATANRLQGDTSDKAGLVSVLLLVSMLSAVLIGFVVGRYLLRSLNTLRTAALDVADRRLPEMVQSFRADTTPEIDLEPVPVQTREEFGELARAFDAVYLQAVRSASEQAGMRGNMRNIFVNMSRRSQTLVERQLKLMEELERNQQDPEQLASLFKLDHLATRMRRNNENLMVLSGTEVARRFNRPAPLADVLRAGASEIEQYQRVLVQSTPPVELVGYAASDLVRLVAELLDNATAFSPPHTKVVVAARELRGGGVMVEVVDQGIGMTDEELAQANAKLTATFDVEIPVSRQMGLFVVGRLADRHGIVVQLSSGGDDREGLRTTVRVPGHLVRKAPGAVPEPGVPEPGAPAPRSPQNGDRPINGEHVLNGQQVARQPVSHRRPEPEPVSQWQPESEPVGSEPVGTASVGSAPVGTASVESEPVESEDGWSSFRGQTFADDELPATSSWFGDVELESEPEPEPEPEPAPVRAAPALPSSWFQQKRPVSAEKTVVTTPVTAAPPPPAPPRQPAIQPRREPLAAPLLPSVAPRHSREVDSAVVPEPPVETPITSPAGLPKRTPRSNLMPSLAERPAQNVPENTRSVHRSAERTRGFLSSFQAGTSRPSVQKSDDDRDESS